MESLQEIGFQCLTDKSTGHSYLPFYEQQFGHLREKPVKLLEIGVEHGCSMKMWLRYFTHPDTRITGIDAFGSQFPFVNDLSPYDRSRLSLYAHSVQYPTVAALFLPDAFDIIVDDGSHILAQQQDAYHYLWPALKSGGWYFIEDIQDTDELWVWSLQPGYFALQNQRETSTGKFRKDDVLVMLRKP